MKIYTCDDFRGHYPVGAAAIVVAEDIVQARVLLAQKLAEHGLVYRSASADQGREPHLKELDITQPSATVLVDGNY